MSRAFPLFDARASSRALYGALYGFCKFQGTPALPHVDASATSNIFNKAEDNVEIAMIRFRALQAFHLSGKDTWHHHTVISCILRPCMLGGPSEIRLVLQQPYAEHIA